MKDDLGIKRAFYLHFNDLIRRENVMPFFYEMFETSTAYVVGGFFRDFLLNKISRDIDIIAELSNDKLIEIIQNNNLAFSTNRHGGIKIKLKSFEIDIWSIHNNWAFKNELVILNEDDKLHSIAKGCFYNYDALVINLSNFNFNLQYFREFITTNKLNILQNNSVYKNLNPSVEANILRAIYLNKQYNAVFTVNAYYYLINKINSISDKNLDVVDTLMKTKMNYPKYKAIEEVEIIKFIKYLKRDFYPNNQILLDL